ncbi:MAG TPA: hypothetical protein VHM90_05730 [Phycisphaerae bacterium]|jgi:hypothetical protein|nr:hypothetical protein [Phycisphaerae bacterium]
MLFPAELVRLLAPNSAKLYLAFLSFFKPDADPPLMFVSLAQLSQRTGLAPRTCTRAIRELKSVHLIHNAPHRYRRPTAYILLPPRAPSPPPQATSKPNASQSSPNQATPLNPHGPSPDQATSPQPRNPAPLAKTPSSPPPAST